MSPCHTSDARHLPVIMMHHFAPSLGYPESGTNSNKSKNKNKDRVPNRDWVDRVGLLKLWIFELDRPAFHTKDRDCDERRSCVNV